MKRRIGVVVTTIYEGSFIDRYKPQIEGASDEYEITFYVIGDLKTDPLCKIRSDQALSEGYRFKYYSVEEQDAFLYPLGKIRNIIPKNSDNRRNVGFLLAVAEDNDLIISIDDDNYPLDGQNFFSEHARVGTKQVLPVAASNNKWVNNCDFISTSTAKGEVVTVFPRGYPYAKRKGNITSLTDSHLECLVAVNMGLWVGDPDVDALTRIVTECKSHVWDSRTFVLGHGERTPINTQNTCVSREAAASYYYPNMGFKLGDHKIDRFGDIFSGYFCQLCAEAVGETIAVGSPLVNQERNEHDLFADLSNEYPGVLFMEKMCGFLESPLPKTSSYTDAYLELAENLKAWSSSLGNMPFGDEGRAFFEEMGNNMKIWIDAYNKVKS